MCGIVGWVGTKKIPSPGAFEAATDILSHRGPDDRGVYSDENIMLGHRRLSIIDLSLAGRQPMVDAESSSVIVFNGEIYNYLELRQELSAEGFSFRTNTDTEVLHAAYRRWGKDCLPRLNGIFAFAIWDLASKTIFMARDRFGVKPLYFAIDDGDVVFASEPKAILALRPQFQTANWKVVYEFLQLGRLHASEESFYDGVKSLLPAHYATYRIGDRGLQISRYWQYPQMRKESPGRNESIEQFAEIFDDAVALRLRSDVPVGVTLSGGLDSSAILASAKKDNPQPITCLTSVFPDLTDNEGVWAQAVASRFDLTVEEVPAPAERWIETLDKIAWHMDSPGYSPAVYPLWCLMARASSMNVPVLLEGQGADEELAGYSHYAIQFLIELSKQKLTQRSTSADAKISQVWSELVANFGQRATFLWLIRELFPSLIAWRRRRVCAGNALRPEIVREITSKHEFSGADRKFGNYDRISNSLWRDHSSQILPGLLHYGDSISMAHSIEARQPFLDYRLVEWLFSQPSSAKIRDGKTKWVLRQYLANNGLDFIAAGRKKVGYLTAEDKWLSDNDYALPKELLCGSESRMRQYCLPAEIDRLLQMHENGAFAAGNHLYRLVSCELWMRNCLTES